MTAVDHAAEARDRLRRGREVLHGLIEMLGREDCELDDADIAAAHLGAGNMFAEAQVHATLALVEETAALRRAQEAANDRERAMSLIFMVGSRDRAVRDAARDGVFWENDEQGEALRPEIARALGLSNDNEETNE